jgi:hypothetical protein
MERMFIQDGALQKISLSQGDRGNSEQRVGHVASTLGE